MLFFMSSALAHVLYLLSRRLPVADRLTMVPLLGALLDYDSDSATYARYDAMTARELFRQYGKQRAGCSSFADVSTRHFEEIPREMPPAAPSYLSSHPQAFRCVVCRHPGFRLSSHSALLAVCHCEHTAAQGAAEAAAAAAGAVCATARCSRTASSPRPVHPAHRCPFPT